MFGFENVINGFDFIDEITTTSEETTAINACNKEKSNSGRKYQDYLYDKDTDTWVPED